MLEIKRECALPVSTDLEACFARGGGSRQGIITATRFQSALVAWFPRIYWTEEKFEPLLEAYACGYSSPTRYQTEVNEASGATQVAWKDFVVDIGRVEQESENFSPSMRRRELEGKFDSKYGAHVQNDEELHFDDRPPVKPWHVERAERLAAKTMAKSA